MKKLEKYIFLIAILFFVKSISFANGETITEVPMKFRGTMPAVEVFVNGKGPFLFAIDTGGQGQARADTTLVEKLNLKKVGEIQAGDGSGKNTRTLDVVQMNSIKVGDLEFKNIEALTRNYNRTPALPKIDGMLGFNLFENHLLTLDYPNKKVLIKKGQLPKANGKNILDFESTNGIASIELKIGKQKVKAHIDSGNMVSGFILPTKTVESLPLIGEPKVVGRARTISNTIEIKQVKLKDSINFGEFEFKQPTVTYPSPREANIGNQLLREFAITFDQKNKRLKLKRTILKKSEPKTTIAKFKEYVGKYGMRTIFEKDGFLYLQREGGPELKLKQEGKDSYSLVRVPQAKIKFGRSEKGKITELKVLNPRGEWETSKKDN